MKPQEIKSKLRWAFTKLSDGGVKILANSRGYPEWNVESNMIVADKTSEITHIEALFLMTQTPKSQAALRKSYETGFNVDVYSHMAGVLGVSRDWALGFDHGSERGAPWDKKDERWFEGCNLQDFKNGYEVGLWANQYTSQKGGL